MSHAFLFTEPSFSAAGVARDLGAVFGRELSYHQAEVLEELDSSVNLTGRVHVQVGADYLVVGAWKDEHTLVNWPARTTLAEALEDLCAALHAYPGDQP